MADSQTGEPAAKKIKRESMLDIFQFDSEEVDALKTNLKQLDEQNAALCQLKVTSCNAAAGYGVTFSKASCTSFRENTKLHSFMSLFLHGNTLVKQFLENGNAVPMENISANLMSKLLLFLSGKDTEKVLWTDPSYKFNKSDWTTRLAHHYFSALSASSSYTLDEQYFMNRCGCGCDSEVSTHYGDTSLGNGAGWHGNVDILIGSYDLSVVMVHGEKPALRRTKIAGGDHSFIDQALAQAIVFSFLQQKHHPERQHLTPCIVASKKNFFFYFYDCKYDKLIESPAFPIFTSDNKLNKLTILATWLVVNYKYLCSGVTDVMVNSGFTADFMAHAARHIGIYRDNLTVARGFETVCRGQLEPWYMNCEVTHGDPVDNEET